MADVSFQKGSYLRARAFLQRYEAVRWKQESLYLGYRIESALGDESPPNDTGSNSLSVTPLFRPAGQQAGNNKMTSQKELIPMLPGDILRHEREQKGLTIERCEQSGTSCPC